MPEVFSARRDWFPAAILVLLVAILLGTGFFIRFNGPPQLILPRQCGSFGPPPQVEFVEDGEGRGRDMRLLRDLTYTDPRGGIWVAKAGDTTDGASIPKELWSLVGGPFEGSYRLAAIIHDQYVNDPDQRWQDVHRIFFYASCAAGVDEALSKKLYGGVMLGGPKWGSGPSNCQASCHVPIDTITPDVSQDDMADLLEWIGQTDPSLEEIDQRVGADRPFEGHPAIW